MLSFKPTFSLFSLTFIKRLCISSSFSAILFMWFSRQEYWNGLPFPSPVEHVLSELFTITHPSWVALHGMAHSFIKLDKVVIHVISLVSFLWYVGYMVVILITKRFRILYAFPRIHKTAGCYMIGIVQTTLLFLFIHFFTLQYCIGFAIHLQDTNNTFKNSVTHRIIPHSFLSSLGLSVLGSCWVGISASWWCYAVMTIDFSSGKNSNGRLEALWEKSFFMIILCK